MRAGAAPHSFQPTKLHSAAAFAAHCPALYCCLQVPIDEKRAINRFCLIRNFATNPAFDFMARE